MATQPTSPSLLSPEMIDEAELLRQILGWVAVPSPTYDAAAVNRAMDLAASDMARLNARLHRQPGRDGFGDVLSARWPADAPAEGGVLVLGHLDTVHTEESIGTTLAVRHEGTACTDRASTT